MSEAKQIEIFVDGDACPVKDEIYKVAERHDVPVTLVANQYFRVPRDPMIRFVKVEDGPDIADDYIAEHAHDRSVVVTADILLADRCLKKGARTIGTTGKAFTENSIGSAVATRALMQGLRETGEMTGGPAPFKPQDRSRFLSSLHEALVQLKRS